MCGAPIGGTALDGVDINKEAVIVGRVTHDGQSLPGAEAGEPGELTGALAHFGFLIGAWEGEGVGGASGLPDFAFAQVVTFSRTVGATLGYTSRVTSIETGAHIVSESGYWRALDDR